MLWSKDKVDWTYILEIWGKSRINYCLYIYFNKVIEWFIFCYAICHNNKLCQKCGISNIYMNNFEIIILNEHNGIKSDFSYYTYKYMVWNLHDLICLMWNTIYNIDNQAIDYTHNLSHHLLYSPNQHHKTGCNITHTCLRNITQIGYGTMPMNYSCCFGFRNLSKLCYTILSCMESAS